MNYLLLTVFAANAVFFLVLFLVGLDAFYRDIIKRGAPFIPIPGAALQYLNGAIRLDDNSVVYDLGSGDGRILISLFRVFPGAHFVGIEYGFLPHIIARIRTAFLKGASIKLIRDDFFRVPLSDATHVIFYLLPRNLITLMPKLQSELKPGTRVISFDFPLPDKTPYQTIETTLERGRFIRFYEL